jgi:hypothetical protein
MVDEREVSDSSGLTAFSKLTTKMEGLMELMAATKACISMDHRISINSNLALDAC